MCYWKLTEATLVYHRNRSKRMTKRKLNQLNHWAVKSSWNSARVGHLWWEGFAERWNWLSFVHILGRVMSIDIHVPSPCISVSLLASSSTVDMFDTDKTRESSRARIAGSMGGDVPEKYYVVQNNEMVRVKYMLVYTSKDAPRRLLFSFVSDVCIMQLLIYAVIVLQYCMLV